MKTSTFYKAPVLKEIEIRSYICSSSPYGDAGKAGNYNSDDDNDYSDTDF